MDGAYWALMHGGTDKEIREGVQAVSVPILSISILTSGTRATAVDVEAVQTIRTALTRRLNHDLPGVRSFCAICLAVVGDEKDAPGLVKLLETTPNAGERDSSRYRLAIALGLFGNAKYASAITPLLKSKSMYDRAGALEGLGLMKATDDAAAVADALDDPEDHVREAAIRALAEMNAVKYAPAIARRLDDSGGDVQKVACYALAALDAKDQAGEIVKVLRGPFSIGEAAKALALLKATEHAPQIAKLADNESSLIRSEALLALGVLGDPKYIPTVAPHLEDKEEYVRDYAAWALILMGDREHKERVLEIRRKAAKEKVTALRSTSFSSLVRNKFKEVKSRGEQNLETLEKE